MNKTLFLPLIILFFIFYYFFFPMESSGEMVWVPSSSHSSDDAVSLNPSENLVFGRGSKRTVVFSDGREPFFADGGRTVSQSDEYVFEKKGEDFYLVSLDNGDSSFLPVQRTPLLKEGHILDADFANSYIRELDDKGNILWQWQGLVPITSFSASAENVAFGSLNGSVRLYGRNGLARIFPVGDAADPVVYGLALSADSSLLAVVTGLKSQKLSLYSREEGWNKTAEYPLPSKFRRTVKLQFSENDAILWVEQEEGVLQIRDGETELLALEGDLFAIADDPGGQVAFLTHSASKGLYELKAYSYEGALMFRNDFSVFPEDFILNDDEMYFSVSSGFIRLDRNSF